MGQTILWETKRHQEDMDVLSTKLRALQSELSTIIHEKSVVETKLIELDQLVGQLLSGNSILLLRKLVIIIQEQFLVNEMFFVKFYLWQSLEY